MLRTLNGLLLASVLATLAYAIGDYVRLRRDNPAGSVQFELGMDVLVLLYSVGVLALIAIASRHRAAGPRRWLTLASWVLGTWPLALAASLIVPAAWVAPVTVSLVALAVIVLARKRPPQVASNQPG